MPSTVRARIGLAAAGWCALESIWDAPRAWVDAARFERVHGPEVLASIESLGFVERWAVPRGRERITFTPWGAWVVEKRIVERDNPERGRWDDPGQEPPSFQVRAQVIGGKRVCGLDFPELVVAPAEEPEPEPEPGRTIGPDGREVLAGEGGAALVLLGVLVPIDRRMKPGKKSRKASA